MRKEECSFFKKRTKKLLSVAYAAGESATALQKSFASFLQKRRVFLLLLLAGPAHAADTITVGSLTLTKCINEYNGYCGTITEPMNRHGGTPGSIVIGFEFYPHTDKFQPSAGLLLAQEGGPGYSTTGSRDGYLRMLTPLRTTRDILLMDKRGTGRSSPIDCPKLQRAYNPDVRQVALCAQQLGSAAWYYRSADAADDLADLMGALGYSVADYYGDSYATWFGQVFAVLHPNLLRSMVLDSAYPVFRDHFDSEVNHGQRAMNLACERSAPCAALGGRATDRFKRLLDSLRAAPVSGTAPGAEGEPLQVTADPAGLFLLMDNAGNNPVTWRDLDAAGRAWLDHHDSLPLLRLIAEARDGNSGGGPAEGFSVGLEDAVECAEYGNGFNLHADRKIRRREYAAFLQRLMTSGASSFPPFEIDDAIYSQMNAEGYDTCLPWPKPPAGVPVAMAVPRDSVFPAIPVLVLSGELDTITSPHEGRDAAKLFPNATFIETTNMIHESAIGDGGVFVPPNGEDLAQCVGPIVRNFLSTGGSTGDTSCVPKIRPIRTVPKFVRDYTGTDPAIAAAGNAVGTDGLVLASAVAETVGDALARYYVTLSGSGAGLRGGSFALTRTAVGYDFTLHDLVWARGLAVSGRVSWNQLTGDISATVTPVAEGHSGVITMAWNDRTTAAVAVLSGTIDGAALSATRGAP
jgi:pimeloyl-ACP methyl ester carboxylesterase